jgi:GTP-binding protein
MSFTIAIVGRPNVGKSTLFNRLAQKKLAIVDDTPGVTRDWRDAEGYLLDKKIRLIDTAGLEESFDDSIEGRMRKQTEEGIEQADAILFLIDGRAGVTPIDEHFAGWLRKQKGSKKKPVVLAVNKCENDNAVSTGMAEAYSLGFGQPIPISSAHGHGIEDLYHAFEPHFPEDEIEIEDGADQLPDIEDLDALEGDEDFDFAEMALPADDDEKPIKIAIVGRPNVGKSTLMNALLDENRVMTGPEAGITRDAIAVNWEFEGRKMKLVDTAGMRRKSKIDHNIEKMSVEDSLRAIRLAQVVVLVIDSQTMLDKQDLQIADHILKEGRALVIAINKWDLIKGDEEKKEALGLLNYKLDTGLGQVKHIPTATISAINHRNLGYLMQSVLDTYALWNKRVPTAKMNRWLAARESQNPAPLVGGLSNRLKYMTQINIRPPTFAVWVSRPKELPETYKRYLMNGLREDFGLKGIAIRLLVRTSKNPFGNIKKKSVRHRDKK